MKTDRSLVGWLAAPAVFYLTIVYALPLTWLLARSMMGPEGFSLLLFREFFADPFSWRVIGNTLRIAGLVTILAAIILPLSIGVVVKAFAWQIVLRRDGVVSQFLVGIGVWSEPQRLLFTETGLVVGAANVFLPFMILPIYSVVKLIDPRLMEAGATLGVSPASRFFRILFPLTLPGIVSGIAFVFSLAVSMFVIPSLLIGDRFQTLATLTGRSFLLMRNEALGSVTATVLLVLAVSIVLISSVLARRVGRFA